jgi:hypothetical protein
MGEYSIKGTEDLPLVLKARDVQQVLQLSKLKTYEVINGEAFRW